MTFFKNKFFIVYGFLCLGSLGTVTSAPNTGSTIGQQQKLNGSIAVLLDKTFSFASQLNRSIEYLAIQISQAKIKTNNKAHSEQWIQEITGILKGIAKDQNIYQFHPIDQAHVIASYIHLLDKLCRHIEKTLGNKLNKFSPFDVMGVFNQGTSIKLQEIPTRIRNLGYKIANIEKMVNEIALTKANKFARVFDKNVVEPWNKYNGTTIAKYSALGGLVCTALLWKHAAEHNGPVRDEFCRKISEDSSSDEFTKWKDDLGDSCKKAYNADTKTFNYDGTVYQPGTRTLTPQYQEYLQHLQKSNNSNSWIMNRLESMMYKTEKLFAFSSSDRMFKEPYDGTKYTPLKQGNSVISSLEKMAMSYLSNPILVPAGGYLISQGYGQLSSNVFPYAMQTMQMFWNNIRGGAFENKEVENVFSVDPKTTLDDVIGMEEVKETLNLILQFLIDPEKLFNTGLVPSTALLMTGPPRTGKTFIVNSFFGSLKKTLSEMGRENEFKYWNVPAIFILQHGIKNILDYALAHAPIVLFIDEIDLLQLQRAGGQSTLLSEFLTSLGGALNNDPKKQVILIAATNKPESLDEALRRTGRLGKEMRFEYPAYESRKAFLIREFKRMALDIKLFDINGLASKTNNKSFEDLSSIIKTGMIRALTRNVSLSQEIIEECLDSEIRNIIMANRKKLPKSELDILASHFAGQALAYQLLDTNELLDKIILKAIMTNIKEELQYVAYTKDESEKQKKIVFGATFTRTSGDSAGLGSQEQIINKIKVLLAGFVAEEILLGSCGYSCHPEFSKTAFELAKSITLEGNDPESLSKAKKNKLLDKAFTLIEQCKEEIRELLSSNKEILQAVANELFQKEEIYEFQVQQIIKKWNTENTST